MFAWLIVVITSVCFLILKVLWWSSSNTTEKYKRPPKFRLPPLLILFIKSLLPQNQEFNPHVRVFHFIRALGRMYDAERIVTFSVPGATIVNVFKPEYLEAILNSNRIINKSQLYRNLHPWLGNGLLISAGDKWKARRRLLTPAFHFKILERFSSVFNTQSSVLIRKLKTRASESFVDIVPIMSLCTLDIIGETAMGIELQAQEREESEYVNAICKLEKLIVRRVLYPWLWPDIIFYLTPTGREFRRLLAIVHNFTRQVIAERKKEQLQKLAEAKGDDVKEDSENIYMRSKKRRAFLDLLLYHHLTKGDLTEEDIREEVDTFMLEGHDTTAMGISWSLYNIGRYANIQEKVYQELFTIFGEDKEREVTPEDIKAMKYLECVIKESLRLYPPVPYISRSHHEEVTMNGMTIPKSCIYSIDIYSIHRDPEFFENPEVFDPERFFRENSVESHPLTFIPFSAGPRNCIGQKFAMMEEKTILANIMRHFQLHSLDPPDKVIECGEIVLRPLNGLRIKFIER